MPSFTLQSGYKVTILVLGLDKQYSHTGHPAPVSQKSYLKLGPGLIFYASGETQTIMGFQLTWLWLFLLGIILFGLLPLLLLYSQEQLPLFGRQVTGHLNVSLPLILITHSILNLNPPSIFLAAFILHFQKSVTIQ